MLMRNPDYHLSTEQVVQTFITATPTDDAHSQPENDAPRDRYSQREMLLGQAVLLLLFVIAVLLSS